MRPTVDLATFFLDVYSRMSSPLLWNPIVRPCASCGHTSVAVHSSAPRTWCCGGLTWRIPGPSSTHHGRGCHQGRTSSSFRACKTFENKSSCLETLFSTCKRTQEQEYATPHIGVWNGGISSNVTFEDPLILGKKCTSTLWVLRPSRRMKNSS